VVAGGALEVPHNVVGREFTTSVELDPFPQVELQLLAVGAPVERLRQARLRYELVILFEQTIPDAKEALAAAAEGLPGEREQVANRAEPQGTTSTRLFDNCRCRRLRRRCGRRRWRASRHGCSTRGQRSGAAAEPYHTERVTPVESHHHIEHSPATRGLRS